MKKLLLTLLIGMFMISCVSAFDWTDGVNSYYQMEEVSGTVYDSIGNYNITNASVAYRQTGRINYGINYSGSQYLSAPQGLIDWNSSSFSLNTWINVDKPEGYIFHSNGNTDYGTSVWIAGTGKTTTRLRRGVDDVTLNSNGTSVNDSAWHMITLVRDTANSKLKLYQDGVLVGEGAETNIATNAMDVNGPVGIGAVVWTGVAKTNSNNIVGKLDEFGMWNRSLNLSDITELYNSGSGLANPNQVNKPTITINSPANNTNNINNTAIFNISILSDNHDLSNVSLIIDGSTSETNSSGLIGNYVFSKLLSNGAHTWSIIAYNNQSNSTQTTTRIINSGTFNIGLCNATLTDVLINFTFKDEENSSNIFATIPSSTFEYWTDSSANSKSYTYINNTENYYYALCGNTGTSALNLDYRMQYESTGYPQRTSEPGAFEITNTTTNKTLYLLNTVDGIYVTFQVINSADQLISGVDVTATREIATVDTVVATGTTGASGSVTFWLNPDFAHDFVFSKTGLTTYEYTDTPTQTSYTITMGGATAVSNSSFKGIDYSITPTDTFLLNGTEYIFAFNLTSSYWDVSDYGFSLRLANGTEIDGSNTGTEGTNLQLTYNVSNQSIIYMDYYWIINGNTTRVTRYWIVSNSENTGWSIKNFFTDLNTYMDSGIFGLDNFGRYLITFLIIFLSVGIMSFKYGFTSPMSITTLTFGIIFFLDVVAGIIPTIRGIPYILTFISALILMLSIFNEVRLR